MRLAALILIAIVSLLHFYFAWFEIFAWETRGPKVFSDFPADLFPKTTQLAANQGIYNSFLAAGLAWSLNIKDMKWQRNVATCFLIFVLVAGVFGAVTVTMTTFYVQSVPAILALVLLHISNRKATTHTSGG
ncbi:MAG: DUF1304 domain-containing protein [Pseudomonadota bacterium]